MELSYGSLPWYNTIAVKNDHPALAEDTEGDIIVIGAGISGALCAYELGKRGYDVIVLEKRRIGRGSTSANTGLLQYNSDRSLTSCIGLSGEQKGIRFYTLCKQGTERLLSIARELEEDPQLYPRSSLYYASSKEDVNRLQVEYETLRRYGFRAVWWDHYKIKEKLGFDKPAAIVTHGDAEVNPYRFTHLLYKAATSKYKLRIYERTKVTQLKQVNGKVRVQTDTNCVASAKHVVVALGYETNHFKPNPYCTMNSTFSIMSQPIPQLQSLWPNRWLIWETKRPYLYMRTSIDNRMMIGGLDEENISVNRRNQLLQGKALQLTKELEALFPSSAPLQAIFKWAATFGITEDGYPFIGPHPRYPGCFFVEAFGGNGTVYSAIAAQIIGDIIEFGSHPDAELFSYTRR